METATKTCSKCGTIKAAGEFYKRQGICKVCISVIHKKYRQENREKVIESRKKYYWENREKILGNGYSYYFNNRYELIYKKSLRYWKKKYPHIIEREPVRLADIKADIDDLFKGIAKIRNTKLLTCPPISEFNIARGTPLGARL
jgi:hypothetical protein